MFRVYQLFHLPNQPVQRFFVAQFTRYAQAAEFAAKQSFSTVIE